MIKYYDTLAAYEADVKSNFESQVSLIGADNTVKYDGRNVVIDIRSARTGTVAVLDGTQALRFISVDTFSSASFMSNFEIVGVVVIGVDHPSFRGQIAIMYPTPEPHEMAIIGQWVLTGYTLDGTDRTGTLSIREKSDNWAANHDYVISYNATDESALVNQLNTYFRANEPFKTQKWVAILDSNNTVSLQCIVVNADQLNRNTGKNGFTLFYNLFPKWAASPYILKVNGCGEGVGTIINLTRALAYFRIDNSNINYNPSTDVTTTKMTYPICLPAYLGTSKYQSDHCAYLRSVYGEGEEGWLKFMETFLPVRPTEKGANSSENYAVVHNNTYYLASQKHVDVDGNAQFASPAANFVANIGFNHELLKKGQWVIPNLDLLFDIIGDIKYPVINDRNADVINRALSAIGAPALRSNVDIWSSSRFSSMNCWYNRGELGFTVSNAPFLTFLVIPLAILDVPQGLNLNK